MSDGFAEMLELQTTFVDAAKERGIDVEVSAMRDGTQLTVRTGIYAGSDDTSGG